MLPAKNILKILSEEEDENNYQNYHSEYDFSEILELLTDTKTNNYEILCSNKKEISRCNN